MFDLELVTRTGGVLGGGSAAGGAILGAVLIFGFSLWSLVSSSGAEAGRLQRSMVLAAVTLFAWIHAIHLGFVWLNVSQNAVEMVTTKLIGGALAYAMVLAHPFVVERVAPDRIYHRVHYGYVGFVMGVTFLARLRGDFDGAENSWFQYTGLGVLGVVLFWWIARFAKERKERSI